MSWNAWSVKAQPLWQAAQPALPLNSRKPRFASSPIAPASPATQRSNGAVPETSLRSKAAIARAMVSPLTAGRSGKAAAKRAE